MTASLSGPSSEAVTVTVSAAAVSPAVSGDFTQSGTTPTIAAGSTTSTGTVTLTGVDNDVDAPNKTVTVSGSASGGRGVSDPAYETLTITDDEGTPTLSLELDPSSVSEDGGKSTVTAMLSGVSSEAVTVTVSAAAVSPAVSGDFTQSGATLTIAAGSTTSTGPVTLTAVDNDVDAADKTVTVSATVSGGNGLSAPSSLTLTITDDEGAPTLSLGAGSFVGQRERREEHGDGVAERPVERGGDADGVGRGGGSGGVGRLHAERYDADDRGGFDDEHGHGDVDGGGQRRRRAEQDGDGVGFGVRRPGGVRSCRRDADDHGR